MLQFLAKWLILAICGIQIKARSFPEMSIKNLQSSWNVADVAANLSCWYNLSNSGLASNFQRVVIMSYRWQPNYFYYYIRCVISNFAPFSVSTYLVHKWCSVSVSGRCCICSRIIWENIKIHLVSWVSIIILWNNGALHNALFCTIFNCLRKFEPVV